MRSFTPLARTHPPDGHRSCKEPRVPQASRAWAGVRRCSREHDFPRVGERAIGKARPDRSARRPRPRPAVPAKSVCDDRRGKQHAEITVPDQLTDDAANRAADLEPIEVDAAVPIGAALGCRAKVRARCVQVGHGPLGNRRPASRVAALSSSCLRTGTCRICAEHFSLSRMKWGVTLAAARCEIHAFADDASQSTALTLWSRRAATFVCVFCLGFRRIRAGAATGRDRRARPER